MREETDADDAGEAQSVSFILPGEVVSGDSSDAAIEEYLDSAESADESGSHAEQTAESGAEGEQVAAEDEALRACVEELVAAVAENETAGS